MSHVIRPADFVQDCANRASTQYFSQPNLVPILAAPPSPSPPPPPPPPIHAQQQHRNAQAASLAEKWNYIDGVVYLATAKLSLALHNTGLFGSSSPIESSAKEHGLAIFS
ncbi:uncharacterized protein BDCG_08853 [Blastomyces dermatitidis ER-3]|uniref:Uncharacterized protein n=1 Tax=Ajellomyces dermatitidis (strain ER-3 / ATCC MYA-2586) TaxID=559297 RepID=A0ABP2EPV7_AJEDR|nr:uncharacterized protein BDCG_08853 [Blastomyces dermatitidis ER-3]EEQ85584.1 hypothetical protein BDCG_08853 [Blastomyces dermatitidis ER-3]